MPKDTIAYLAFTGKNPDNENTEDASKNSLAFDTWYSSLDMSRIVYAFQTRDAQPKEWFPLIAAIGPEQCPVKTVVEALIGHFLQSPSIPYLPFILTIDPGGSHYVAGILMCFNEQTHLYLFDPLGRTHRQQHLSTELKPLMRSGNNINLNLHFFQDSIQKVAWEGDGIYSCGPLCIEFIKSVLDHPEWVNDLSSYGDDALSVAGFFEPLFLNEETYKNTILQYRQEHADLLNQLDDDKLKLAFDAQYELTKGLQAILEANNRYDFDDDHCDDAGPVLTVLNDPSRKAQDFEDKASPASVIFSPSLTSSCEQSSKSLVKDGEKMNEAASTNLPNESETDQNERKCEHPTGKLAEKAILVYAEERTKLDQLAILCRQYMDYALQQLEQEDLAADTLLLLSASDNEKTTNLKKKYNTVRKLYDIAIHQTGTLQDFEDELNNPACETILKSHRDNMFARLIACLWGIIAAIPRMLFYSSPTGFFQHPCFWRSHSDELRESLDEKIRNDFV